MSNARSVSRSRFELEEMGETAYLEFDLDSAGWITLLHTEVPEALRDNNLKVDVVCPLVANYLSKHPEFQDLVGQ
jgi:predicted GNAT family acetyltransferase